MSPAPRSALLASGSAPGKLILFGEHAVVYGYPALAGAADLDTTVSLFPGQGPTRLTRVPLRSEQVERAVARFLPPTGLEVEIRTQLPIGRGMGSSASLSVALVRAAAALQRRSWTEQELFDRSLELERIFHGHPSGVDNAVVLHGGLIRFQRGPPLEITPLALPRPLPLVILDSGSTGDTAALVAGVRAQRPAIDPQLARIGALADEACGALHDLPALGSLMNRNHALLRAVGVSSLRLDELAQLARQHGALGAKLSGAGGGGVVLALAPGERRAALLRAAERAGIRAFAAQLSAGAPGKGGSS